MTALAAGCDSGSSAPSLLMDGSRARTSPIEFQGTTGPVLQTTVRLVQASGVRAGSLAAACLGGPARDSSPSGPVVERVGVAGESVTVAAASWLHGCDDSPGPREGGRRWCASSSGRLYGGRLRDPRLAIAGCTAADGAPMGFAWVQPSRGARYLVVEQPGYAEVYETAAGLPVRVATTVAVSLERSSALFDLSEHDARGALIRRYELEARVAG